MVFTVLMALGVDIFRPLFIFLNKRIKTKSQNAVDLSKVTQLGS